MKKFKIPEIGEIEEEFSPAEKSQENIAKQTKIFLSAGGGEYYGKETAGFYPEELRTQDI